MDLKKVVHDFNSYVDQMPSTPLPVYWSRHWEVDIAILGALEGYGEVALEVARIVMPVLEAVGSFSIEFYRPIFNTLAGLRVCSMIQHVYAKDENSSCLGPEYRLLPWMNLGVSVVSFTLLWSQPRLAMLLTALQDAQSIAYKLRSVVSTQAQENFDHIVAITDFAHWFWNINYLNNDKFLIFPLIIKTFQHVIGQGCAWSRIFKSLPIDQFELVPAAALVTSRCVAMCLQGARTWQVLNMEKGDVNANICLAILGVFCAFIAQEGLANWGR